MTDKPLTQTSPLTIPDPPKLLELIAGKCDTSKKELDKIWTYQLISVGVSIGLLFGLGHALSRHFLDEEGHERVLYVVLPLINLYLLIRFGNLSTNFFKIRAAQDHLATTYWQSLDAGSREQIDPAIISDTTSYFEYYHEASGSVSMFLYSLLVPVALSVSHATSFLLLGIFVSGSNRLTISITLVFIWGGYLMAILSLYRVYYSWNEYLTFKLSEKPHSYVRYSMAVCAVLSVVFFVLFWYTAYDLFTNYADAQQGWYPP